ncbi:MAG: M16 family metallopeptidase [Vicinamibacteria bacterium]
MNSIRARLVAALAVSLLTPFAASAQDLASFEKRVTRKVLPNGLRILVCERREAPVFSFLTHVDVGSDREVPGTAGLAHMFEHMAFKGTDTIGTTDFAAEKIALEKVEVAYAAYDLERRRPVGRDDKRLADLEKAWKAAMAEADQYVVRNAFGEIIEREGGVGLNASTGNEATRYHYSLPANRLELWAYLESERFLKPVMREFYKERDVVMVERRMRVDSNPVGRTIEQLQAAAFTAHSYGQPPIGWPSDLRAFSATDAKDFFERYYVPANMVVAVVGDVSATDVVPLAEKYLGRLPFRPVPPPLRTEEPPQKAERQVVVHDPAQPFYAEAYHKGNILDPDDAVYDVISDLLSAGRTSRLYRSLVRDKRIAAGAGGFGGFPGDKYPNLFVVYAFPTPGHAPEEVRDGIRSEIERLKNEDVTAEELQMVKTRAKADLIRSLDGNEGLAQELALYETRYGDWRELFRQVDRIEKVTKEDVRRVALKTFVESNRTVAMIQSTQMAGAPPKGGH